MGGPFDVEGVDVHGAGIPFADAIEEGSILRAHRAESHRDPIVLMAEKSSPGNSIECSGLASLLQTLQAAMWGRTCPNLHLRQANPNMDVSDHGDHPVILGPEILELERASTFLGTMARG